MTSSSQHARVIMQYALAAIYFATGVAHLWAPEKFLLITPDWVPAPLMVIYATGLCEIAGSIALMTTRWRRLAGLLFALYAVSVFPANIKHAFDGIEVWPIPQSWWYHGPRLAFQPVLVWWPLFCSGVIDWPAQESGS